MAASSWAAPIKYSILVVDDMQTDQRVLAAHLERMGHNVLTASSGEQALRYLFSPSFVFDIVLLDVHLGTMSGLEVLQQIQERPDLRDSLCVIMVTSDVAESSLMTSVLVGARGFLLKPVNAKKLSSAITRAMSTPPTHHHAAAPPATVGTATRRAALTDVSSPIAASGGQGGLGGLGAAARKQGAVISSPQFGQTPRSPERPAAQVDVPLLQSPPMLSAKTTLVETLLAPSEVAAGAGGTTEHMLPGQANASPARASLGSVPVDMPSTALAEASSSTVQVTSQRRGESRADATASSAGSDEEEDDVFGPGSSAGPTPRRRKESHTHIEEARASRELRKARSGGSTASSSSGTSLALSSGSLAQQDSAAPAPAPVLGLGLPSINAAFGGIAGTASGLTSLAMPVPAAPSLGALSPTVNPTPSAFRQAVAAPPPVPPQGMPAAPAASSATTAVVAVRPAAARPVSTSGGGAPPTLRALVVDDSRVILQSVTRALQKANIAVEVAESGTAALNILRREEAHRLALVQQQQQFLNGKGAAAQAKARRLQGLTDLAGQGALAGPYGTSMQGGGAPGLLTPPFGTDDGGNSQSSALRRSPTNGWTVHGHGHGHGTRQAWGDGSDPVALTLFPGSHPPQLVGVGSAVAKPSAEHAVFGAEVPHPHPHPHLPAGTSANPLFTKAHTGGEQTSAPQAPTQPITPIDPDKPLFDIMLLDLIMPYMDGRDVLRHMKNMIPSGVIADAHHFTPCVSSIPVVVMTAMDDTEGVSECFDFGAEDVLQKPVRGDVLLARINKVLSARNLTSFMSRHMDVLAGAQTAAAVGKVGAIEADASTVAKEDTSAASATDHPVAAVAAAVAPLPQAGIPPLAPALAIAARTGRPPALSEQGLESVVIGGTSDDEAVLLKAARALGLSSASALRALVESRRGSTTSNASPASTSAASSSAADAVRRSTTASGSSESTRPAVSLALPSLALPSKGQATEGHVPELVLPAFIRNGLGKDSEQLLNDTSVTAGGDVVALSLSVSVVPSPTSAGAAGDAEGLAATDAFATGSAQTAEKLATAGTLTLSTGSAGGAFQPVHTLSHAHHLHNHLPGVGAHSSRSTDGVHSTAAQAEVLKLKEQLLQEKRRRVTDVKALQEKLVALESTAKTSSKDLAFAKKQITSMSEQLQGLNAQSAQLRSTVKVLQKEAAGRGYIPSFYTPNPFASKERLSLTAGAIQADSSLAPGPGQVLAVPLSTGTAIGIADMMEGISVPLGPGVPTEVVTVGIAPRSSSAVFHLPSVLIVPHETADPTSMLIRGLTLWQAAKAPMSPGPNGAGADDEGTLAIPAPPGWKPLTLCVGSLPAESTPDSLSERGRAVRTSFASCAATQIPLPPGGLTASSPEWINITASVAGLPAFFSSLFLHFIWSLSPHAAVRAVLGFDHGTQVASGVSPQEPRIYAEDWAWYCAFNAPMNTGPTSMTRAGRLWSVLCVQAGGPAHGWLPLIKPSLGLDDLRPIVHGLIAFHRDLASLRGDVALEGAYSDWVLAAIITSLSGHGRCHMTYQSVLGSNLVEALHVLTTTPTRQVAPFAPDAFLKSLSEFDRARRLSDPDYMLPETSERGTTNSSLTTASTQASDGSATPKEALATRPEGLVSLLGMARSAQRVSTARVKTVLTATGGAGVPSTTTIAGRLSPYVVYRLLTGGRLPTPSGNKASSSPGLSWRDWVYLTLAERDRCSEESASYWFAALDADGDGYISLEDARMALAGKALTWTAVLEASTDAVLDPAKLLGEATGGSVSGASHGSQRAWQGSLASRPPPGDMHGGEINKGTAYHIKAAALSDMAKLKEEYLSSAASPKRSRGTMSSPGNSPNSSPSNQRGASPAREATAAAGDAEDDGFGLDSGPQPLGKQTTTARAKAARSSASSSPTPMDSSQSAGSPGGGSPAGAARDTSSSSESDESGSGASRGRSIMSILSELWDQVSPARPERGITLLDLRRSGAGPRMYELLIAANKGPGKW